MSVSEALGSLGVCLLKQGKFAEAEPVLRRSLAIRETKLPDDWSTFNAMSMLGGSLLGQKRYIEAEPVLVRGYDGMKDRESKIPSQNKIRPPEAAERIVALYDAWGKPAEAAAWRAKLARPSEMLPADVFAPSK